MKSLFLIVAVLLIVPAMCLAAGYTKTEKAGGYSVQVLFDRDRPVLGQNRVEIAIIDKSLRPVTGARMKIDYLMPSLPGKPPMMAYSMTARPVDGRYEATLDLSMKGLWQMVVSVTEGQRTEKATFNFEVR